MNHEIIELSHGYTARIEQDTDAENPFDAWDCEPPIAVLNWERYHARLTNYKGDELNLSTLLDLIPADKWNTRAGKREILNALDLSPKTVAQEMRYHRDSFRDSIHNYVYELKPYGWSEWGEYFEAMEAVAAVAGIPCHRTQSNGYSQGDCALVFVAATPAWAERVGIDPETPPETLKVSCETACDLWSAWAWGDVYGVAAIYDPNGEELDDGSCWGFYGDDHDESGLKEHCESTVKWHLEYTEKEARRILEYNEKEAQRIHEAACRDIVTV